MKVIVRCDQINYEHAVMKQLHGTHATLSKIYQLEIDLTSGLIVALEWASRSLLDPQWQVTTNTACASVRDC